MDIDSKDVAGEPVITTVAQLASVKRPTGTFPYNRRVSAVERATFVVKARLDRVSAESDSDMHLVLRDLDVDSISIIAEIPDSACAVGSQHATAYAEARRSIRGVKRGAIVEVVGVGFFDFLHGQSGGSQNGVELHPILSIRIVDPVAR